jgi:hypothetical protein
MERLPKSKSDLKSFRILRAVFKSFLRPLHTARILKTGIPAVLVIMGLLLVTGCMEISGPASEASTSQASTSPSPQTGSYLAYLTAGKDSSQTRPDTLTPALNTTTTVVGRVGTTTLKVTFQTVVPHP